ncbi:MAG: glycosyltransferase [Hespellia sp.]|nr:glycosyltransferase [Hespellia sp.]
MLFSIILPVYNVEKYLQECVDSILKQTFVDYEIILVDDGSTDESPQLCDRLAENYECIRVIHKKNGGISDSRNCGTKLALGEYIIYIDSDDFLIKDDFLKKLAEKTKNKSDLIFYKYQKYYDLIQKFEDCRYAYFSAMEECVYADQISALVKDDAFYGMAWIKAIRKEIIDNHGIEFEIGLLGEDMDWNYHIIFNSTSIAFIDESFIAYRQREGSITATHKLKNLTDFVYILEKWSKKITNNATDDKLKIALYGSLAKYYCNLLIVYSRLADPEKKKSREKIKQLDWLLKYSMSRRPRMISKIYRIIGFDLTIEALKIMDRIK